MTPTEIRSACIEIAALIGGSAQVSFTIETPNQWDRPDRKPVRAVCWPEGICGGSRDSIGVYGDTFDEARDALASVVRARRDELDAERVRRMALVIIEHARPSGEIGELRLLEAVGGDENVMRRLLDDALAMASRMAARGPFRVIGAAPVGQAAE